VLSNTRRTPEEPRRTQKEKNTSPPVFCVIEHQKNTRRTPEGTPEEPRRTQKEKNTSPPQFSTFNGIDGGGKSAPLRSRKFCQDGSALGTGREHLVAVVGDGDLRDRSI
jgi:hypothetical protein